jgi:NADP-dependent 3-hydroxy acid dehydrogenase YdfG
MRAYFQDKVVIVTGSGAGIGKATAQAFCEKGAKVLLNGREEEKLCRLKNEWIARGYEVDYFAGDVTDEKVCLEMAGFAHARYGRVDVLITNASVSMNARFDEMKPELFKMVCASNIYGAAIPAMCFLNLIKKSKGSILFIGSLAGIHGMPRASAYSVGKMGLRGLQESLEIELTGSGVHIGLLEPGFTKNDAAKKLVTGTGEWKSVPKRSAFLQQTPQQVAEAITEAVQQRTRRKTLSFAGWCLRLMTRYCPGLLRRLLLSGR